MEGYLQEEPRGTQWRRAYFTAEMVDGRWSPLFDRCLIRGRPIIGTMDEIQQKAKDKFGDMTVYVTPDGRVCFGDIPLQSPAQQFKGLARRILKGLTS